MKIGITGASGFVGRNLQWRLRELKSTRSASSRMTSMTPH